MKRKIPGGIFVHMNKKFLKEIWEKKIILTNSEFLFFFRTIISTIGVTYAVDIPIVSIYPLILMFVIGFLFSHKDTDHKDIFVSLCAGILAVFLSMGRVDFIREGNGITALWRVAFMLIGCYWFLEWIVAAFYSYYERRTLLRKEDNKLLEGKYVFLLTFILLLCCWLPVWASQYPAIMTPDSIVQAMQALGHSSLVDHHPIAHTLWIRMWYKIVTLFSKDVDIITAFGRISLVQLFIMNAIFSMETVYLYKRIKKWTVILFSTIFYGLVAYNALYSVTMWKDVLHGGITVLFLLILCRYFEQDTTTIKRKISSFFLIFICGCAFCLFRSNAYYALALWSICVIYYGIIEKDKVLISAIIAALVCCTVIQGPIFKAMGIAEKSYVEGLSIPIQQIAYVITKDNIAMTEEEYNLLSQVVDVEKIPESYQDWLSDPIKELFNQKGNKEYFEDHKFDYLKLWIKLGLRDPAGYVTAWIKQTYGYWYPNVSYGAYSTEVYENDLGLRKRPLVSDSFVSNMERNASSYTAYPLLGSLWNLGTFTWMVVMMLFYSLRQRNLSMTLNYVLLFAIWISIMLGTPLYAEFRYYYSVVASLPLILLMPAISKGSERKEA